LAVALDALAGLGMNSPYGGTSELLHSHVEKETDMIERRWQALARTQAGTPSQMKTCVAQEFGEHRSGQSVSHPNIGGEGIRVISPFVIAMEKRSEHGNSRVGGQSKISGVGGQRPTTYSRR
jgi:hypothetical protein